MNADQSNPSPQSCPSDTICDSLSKRKNRLSLKAAMWKARRNIKVFFFSFLFFLGSYSWHHFWNTGSSQRTCFLKILNDFSKHCVWRVVPELVRVRVAYVWLRNCTITYSLLLGGGGRKMAKLLGVFLSRSSLTACMHSPMYGANRKHGGKSFMGKHLKLNRSPTCTNSVCTKCLLDGLVGCE